MNVTPRLLLTVFFAMACSDAPAPHGEEASDPHRIEGAWRLVERKEPGPQGTLNTTPQPGLRLFVDGHSCLVRVDTAEPRLPLAEETATAAELLAAWGPFVAQCGTYVVETERIVERYLVSKSPSGMTGNVVNTQSFRFSGDTLWLSTVETAAGTVPLPGYSKFVRAR